MNREFKFRAFNGARMIYRGLHDKNWYTDPVQGKLVCIANQRDQINFKVMQYTGFKDSNGREIYDGDILVYERNVCIPESCIVFWSKESGWVVDIQGNDYDGVEPLSEFDEDELKIVGNIYENPELMEVNNV